MIWLDTFLENQQARMDEAFRVINERNERRGSSRRLWNWDEATRTFNVRWGHSRERRYLFAPTTKSADQIRAESDLPSLLTYSREATQDREAALIDWLIHENSMEIGGLRELR
jgi:hypothetical protein